MTWAKVHSCISNNCCKSSRQ